MTTRRGTKYAIEPAMVEDAIGISTRQPKVSSASKVSVVIKTCSVLELSCNLSEVYTVVRLNGVDYGRMNATFYNQTACVPYGKYAQEVNILLRSDTAVSSAMSFIIGSTMLMPGEDRATVQKEVEAIGNELGLDIATARW